jgi:hypothetical protein
VSRVLEDAEFALYLHARQLQFEDLRRGIYPPRISFQQLREWYPTLCEREGRMKLAAGLLAPSLPVLEALIRGRVVPREALHPDFRDRIVCWDGILDYDVALDVIVLHGADLAAEPVETPPAPAWQKRRAA